MNQVLLLVAISVAEVFGLKTLNKICIKKFNDSELFIKKIIRKPYAIKASSIDSISVLITTRINKLKKLLSYFEMFKRKMIFVVESFYHLEMSLNGNNFKCSKNKRNAVSTLASITTTSAKQRLDRRKR